MQVSVIVNTVRLLSIVDKKKKKKTRHLCFRSTYVFVILVLVYTYTYIHRYLLYTILRVICVYSLYPISKYQYQYYALVSIYLRIQIGSLCRTWSQFVDCVKRYTDLCFTETKRKEFHKAVENPVDLVHQMCTSADYQTGTYVLLQVCTYVYVRTTQYLVSSQALVSTSTYNTHIIGIIGTLLPVPTYIQLSYILCRYTTIGTRTYTTQHLPTRLQLAVRFDQKLCAFST